MNILCAVWCERSVLFVCPDINILTSIVFATVPTVRPMSWQGIFIPLLPTTISDCIDAPVPYIIGIPALPEGEPPSKRRVDGVLVVDVLNDVVYNWGERLPEIPENRVLSGKLKPLHASVYISPKARSKGVEESALRGSTERLKSSVRLSEVLVEYTTWVLSQVRSHYKSISAKTGKPATLAVLGKSFTASAKRQNKQFIENFVGTQQFSSYFYWNISLLPPGPH